MQIHAHLAGLCNLSTETSASLPGSAHVPHATLLLYPNILRIRLQKVCGYLFLTLVFLNGAAADSEEEMKVNRKQYFLDGSKVGFNILHKDTSTKLSA